MMSPAMLTRLALLLITQQATSRPADSAGKAATAQSDNNVFPILAGDESENLANRGVEKQSETITLPTANAETEEPNPVSRYYPVTGQWSPTVTMTPRDNPTATLTSSVTTPPSQFNPSGSYRTRGFLSDLLGSVNPAGSQKQNEFEAGSQTPIKAGQQSATIISATTYPEGSKPVNGSKPAAGQEKPTTQDKPTVTVAPPVTSPPSHSKPPGSPLNAAFLSSLFGIPAGSQNPNKPPAFFGSGASQFGSFSQGSPFSGTSATFPDYMAWFLKPPQAGYMAGHVPPMFNGPFNGFGSPFGGLESSFGGLESPFGGLKSPFGGLKSPLGGLGSPFGGLGNPFWRDDAILL